MRKLVVSMNITLDGCVSGSRGELDWHFNSWTPEMGDALCGELAKADTILLGRKTYVAMASHWPLKVSDPNCRGEDFAFANMMNTYRKIVFSTTLRSTQWSNAVLAKGCLQDHVDYLKQLPGKNIMVYGSAQLVHTLIKTRLVDEYQLWFHPVVIGKGKSLFKPGIFQAPGQLPLKLIKMERYKGGVVRLDYQPGGLRH